MLRRTIFESISRLQENINVSDLHTLFTTEEGKFKTLQELLNTIVTSDDKISSQIPIGTPFSKVLKYPLVSEQLKLLYAEEFSMDIKTKFDIELFCCYITNTMLPQVEKRYDDGTYYISKSNPKGTVSRAEFFDGINAIKYSANSITNRNKSIDGKIYESDYFNEGYNLFCRDKNSVLYNMLTRAEVIQPITWLEVLYYLTFAYEPIQTLLHLENPNIYDFSTVLHEDIDQVKYTDLALSFKYTEDGLLDYKILQKPISETIPKILSKQYAMPYMFWFCYQRLMELEILNISIEQLFTYLTREQLSSVLFRLPDVLKEREVQI